MSRRDPAVSLGQMRDHAQEAIELVRGRDRTDLDAGSRAVSCSRQARPRSRVCGTGLFTATTTSTTTSSGRSLQSICPRSSSSFHGCRTLHRVRQGIVRIKEGFAASQVWRPANRPQHNPRRWSCLLVSWGGSLPGSSAPLSGRNPLTGRLSAQYLGRNGRTGRCRIATVRRAGVLRTAFRELGVCPVYAPRGAQKAAVATTGR
jgi:hypothetical protein